jgi:hypothetical protein
MVLWLFALLASMETRGAVASSMSNRDMEEQELHAENYRQRRGGAKAPSSAPQLRNWASLTGQQWLCFCDAADAINPLNADQVLSGLLKGIIVANNKYLPESTDLHDLARQ